MIGCNQLKDLSFIYLFNFLGKMTDVAAWNECVDNSLAQLEHQRTRIVNLELMQDYGSDAWKVYNETLQKLTNHLQVNKIFFEKSLLRVKAETQWTLEPNSFHFVGKIALRVKTIVKYWVQFI